MRCWGILPILDWVVAADCYLKQDYHSSIIFYRRGLARHKGHRARPSAELDLAMCYLKTGETNKALSQALGLVRSGIDHEAAYILVAKILVSYGRLRLASSILSRGHRKCPQSVKILIQQGYILYQLSPVGRDSFASVLDGIKVLMRDSSTSGYYDDYNTVRALWHYSHGSVIQARLIIDQMLEKGVFTKEAILARAEDYAALGNIVSARLMLRQVLEMDPDELRAHIALAQSYLESDKEEDLYSGIQLARVACEKSSWRNPRALVLFADAMERTDDRDMADLLRLKALKIATRRTLTFTSVDKATEIVRQLQQIP